MVDLSLGPAWLHRLRRLLSFSHKASMTEHFITAISGGIVDHSVADATDRDKPHENVTFFDTLNGRDQQLRAGANRVRQAAKKAGVDHPLLRDVLGIIVYGFCVDPSPPHAEAMGDMAHHWLEKMTGDERRTFVRELLEASRSPHRVRSVPHELVSEGVSIVTRAANEWVARHPRPTAVPLTPSDSHEERQRR